MTSASNRRLNNNVNNGFVKKNNPIKQAILKNGLRFLTLPVLCTSTMLATAIPVYAAEQSNAQQSELIAQANITYNFSVPSQSLVEALNSFAEQADIAFAYKTSDLENLDSRGFNGVFSVREALLIMLTNTGITATFTDLNTVTLAIVDSSNASNGLTELAPARVNSNSGAIGSADDGYKTDVAGSIGPFKNMELKDAPYSIQIISGDFMKNIIASSPDKVLAMNPVVKMDVPDNTNFTPGTTIRGFGVRSSSGSTAINGIRTLDLRRTPVTDLESIEVLSGLSGFLYGATNPGGFINYVLKKASYEKIANVTAGNYGGSNYFLHGDFGGRINQSETLAYRFNVMKRSGEMSLDDNDMDEVSLSAALDWRITNNIAAQFNIVHNDSQVSAGSAYWNFRDEDYRPSKVPDASKDWTQSWTIDEIDLNRVIGSITWNINETFSLRGAYTHKESDREGTINVYNFVEDNTGSISPRVQSTRLITEEEDAYNIYLDSNFSTGIIDHALTAGYSSVDNTWILAGSFFDVLNGDFSFNAPTSVLKPSFETGDNERSSLTKFSTFTIGDVITISERWNLIAGLTHIEIDELSGSDGYNKSEVTPSLSVTYKPTPWLSVYGSYLEGFESGGVAPDTTVNAREILEPLVSTQYEIGLKAEVGQSLVTLALFDIDKPHEFTNSQNVYKQDGRQIHRGIEFTSTGKVTDYLSVLGGITWIDAKVAKSENPLLEGKMPTDVAEIMAKIYMEYQIPNIPELTLNAGVFYTGQQYTDEINNYSIPSYTTVDLGMRYELNKFSSPITLILNASNITNENYWVSSHYLGTPRAISFSAEMSF